MKRLLPFVPLFVLLAGCSTGSSLESMQNDPATLKAVHSFPESYEVVYARIARQGHLCHVASGTLYPERSYGQVDLINTFGIAPKYTFSARIEKAGTGSKVTIYSGNNWVKQAYIDNIIGWASGSTKCSAG